MRVLVCGGRDFQDDDAIDFMAYHLCKFHEAIPFSVLIHGAARGADSIAGWWADEMGIPTEEYPISKQDWNTHGKRAGYLRNKQMYDEGRPDLVMAFPGGNGTQNMVDIATRGKTEVWQSRRIYFRKEDRQYGFLSNFALIEFVDPDGLIWPTSEHYFQAHKSPFEEERGHVQMAPSPNEAKRRGRNDIQLVANWDEIKEDVMRDALRYKFSLDSEAGERLLDTGDDYLIEYAPWGDTYWGVDKSYHGRNRLGILLMERREALREEIITS